MGRLYLVTGAAGHLGSAVVGKLLEHGERVRALVLPGEKNIPQGVELCYADVCKPAQLDIFFSNPDSYELIVIHCAGIVSIASKNEERVRDVNVNGTKNIVEQCLRRHVSRLIYISSVHAIPVNANGAQMSEVVKFDPDKVVGLYAKTKAEASQYVLDAVKCGLNACIVHPSGIIGPYDKGRNHLTSMIVDFCKGRLTAGVKGGYDFVDVRDVADGIVACVDKGKIGECYILSGRYCTVEGLLLLLHCATGLRNVKLIFPLWFAKLFAPFAELYYKIVRRPPLFTGYSLYTLGSNALFSHKKAERDLGYKARPLESTIKDTVMWLKLNKVIG